MSLLSVARTTRAPAARPALAPVAPAPARERVPVLGPAAALMLANLRYWSAIAPLVRRELRRWATRAAAIPTGSVRGLAQGKLRVEHFNAEVAATFATLVPRAHRRGIVEAIVAFEVLYDYLDGLTERLEHDALARGELLYRPFTAVFAPASTAPAGGGDRARADEVLEDGGYAEALAATVRAAFAGLPSHGAVAAVAARAARRCAEAQVRVHAAGRIGTEELERWAREQSPADEGLEWRAYVAGSVASVLSVHALIAAAAEPALEEAEARAIDRAYLYVSALSTMLDSLVDYERDVYDGEPWLARLYGGLSPLGARLGDVARPAVRLTRRLPRSAHHMMTLLGVVAYYTSAAEAGSEPARAAFAGLHRELRPVILPTLAVMRAWRLARRLRKGSICVGSAGAAR